MAMGEPQKDTDAGPPPPAEAFPDHLMPLEAVYDETGGTYIDSLAEGRSQIADVQYPWDGDAELLLGKIFAAAGTAAHELPDEYDPAEVIESAPQLLQVAEASGPGGPVAEALCALKEAADYIEEKTNSTLGAGRLHRLADDAAEALHIEIQKARRDDE